MVVFLGERETIGTAFCMFQTVNSLLGFEKRTLWEITFFILTLTSTLKKSLKYCSIYRYSIENV